MLKLHRCILLFRAFNQQPFRFQSTNAYSSKWVSSSLQRDLEIFSKQNSSPISICLIGDPHLRRRNELVLNIEDDFVRAAKCRLHLALAEFRRKNGFGRGMSACQIGINLRMIAVNLGYGPLTLINPEMVWASTDKITMWDDCMSIPHLLIRKQRFRSISIVYTDDDGNEQNWNELDVSVSELLQHEMDHLNGILNIDKPFIDDNPHRRESIINMDEYEKQKQYFNEQVDYTIVPTV